MGFGSSTEHGGGPVTETGLAGTLLRAEFASRTVNLCAGFRTSQTNSGFVAFVDDCPVEDVAAEGFLEEGGGVALEFEWFKGGEFVDGRKNGSSCEA